MKLIVGFLALLAMCGVAQAQVHCDGKDTYDTCSDKLAGQVTEKGEAVLKGSVAAKNTGDASTSTINDFLPLLRALVDTSGLGGEDGKLGFEWSNPLGLPEEEQNKLTVALVKSELYEPLKAALRAASLADQIGVLEDKINEGDDVSVGFSYSRASERYGRDPLLHADIVSSLLAAASARDTNDTPLTDFELRILQSGRKVDFDVPFGQSGLTAQEQAKYIGLVEDSILGHHKSMRAFGERLHKLGLYSFLDLVNNQPQWSVTANYRSRDEAVGPDEFKASLSYEKGWANVNRYRDYKKRSCGAGDDATCLAKYLADGRVMTDLAQSLRVSVKVEYSKVQRLDFVLPSSTFAFSGEPAKRLSFSAGIGRYIGSEVQGITRARIDAALSYENFSDDPSRQDRGLATVTLTYPVSEGFFLSLGAVYATKPEFRGDVNDEISARAGIVYKVIPGG